jgi:radical SAM superfamily enzyme YgiQ (UPF0313 family)
MTRLGADEMKRGIVLIWPWSAQHARTHETFPIGLGYLANAIDPRRFDVTVQDCALDDLHPDGVAFREALSAIRPDIVGISCWSLNVPVIEKTIRAVKSLYPQSVLCLGGPHATARGEALILDQDVDYVFHGEAEIGFRQLVEAIQDCNGRPADAVLARIPGLIYRDAGRQVKKNSRLCLPDLDTLGAIDYRRLRLNEYHKQGYSYGAKLNKEQKLSAPIITTRGCPYTCTFCMGPLAAGRKVRRHSIEQITGAVNLLYHQYGVRYISIVDDNFTMHVRWAEDVCNAIIALGLPDLTMGTPNGIRMEQMTESLAAAMARAGWKEVLIAPESGSPRTLLEMRKQLDLSIVPGVVDLFHRVGIEVSAFFIIGYPSETMEDIAMTERFIFENRFDFCGISIFQPLPGTSIFQTLVSEGRIPDTFVPGHYQEVTFQPAHIDKQTLCDEYNRLWNAYRESRGLPIKNRRVATIRLDDARG